MNDKFLKLNYSVLEDKSLSDKDKIVLSIISSLTNNKGYAYATNKYISDIVKCTPKTISKCINHLKRLNYLSITDSKSYKRKMYLTSKINSM